MQYSFEFKAQDVEKALSLVPDVSFNFVAQSFGIYPSLISLSLTIKARVSGYFKRGEYLK